MSTLGNFVEVTKHSTVLDKDLIDQSVHAAPEVIGRHLDTWKSRGDVASIIEPSVSCRTLVHIWESRSSMAKSQPVTPPREDTFGDSCTPKSSVSTCEGLATPEENHQLRRQQSLSTSEGSDLSAVSEAGQDEPPHLHDDTNPPQEDMRSSTVPLALADSAQIVEIDTRPLKSVQELRAMFGQALCPSCGTSFR
eukprot:jgi/Botrbrau1/8861/Bobra.50_2s0018.1